MDTLTQGIIGGWLTKIILDTTGPKKDSSTSLPPYRANTPLILGALICNIPDLDVFIGRLIPRSSQVDAFLFHRDIMHSIWFAVPIALLCGRIITRSYPRQRTHRWLSRSLASLVSIVLGHLFIDTMTSYGTRLLTPIIETTYSRDNIFVVDPWLTGPILLLRIITLIVRPQQKTIRTRIGMSITIVYIGWTFIAQSRARTRFDHALIEADVMNIQDMRVMPEPLQSFLWRGIARSETGYYEMYTSIRDDPNRPVSMTFYPDGQRLAGLIQSEAARADYQRLVSVSQGYYRLLPLTGGDIQFDFLRFGELNGRERQRSSSPMFALRYDRAAQTWIAPTERGGSREITSDLWSRFWQRVWGG